LDGSTGAGAVTINGSYTNAFGSTTYLAGSIVNNAAQNGNILVNGGSGYDGTLQVPGSATLSGGGTVTLNTDNSGYGGYAYLSLPNTASMLSNVDNTIQGTGIISNNGTLINETGGTIDANSSYGTPLSLQGGAVTNAGVMEATGSGVLELYQTTVNNAGGAITAVGSNASVWLDNGAVVQGGTLTNNSGLFFGTPTSSSATLDGSTGAGAVTINGSYTNAFGSTTYLAGSIVNNAAQNGNILVNGGNGSDGYLWVATGATLAGGGVVSLNTSGGGGSARLYLNDGATLDNVDNTIQGEGVISLNNSGILINEAGGTVLANSTGWPLTSELDIQSGTVTNFGTLQVNSGNLLHLVGGTLTNFSGATLTGGTYNIYGAAALPGTLQIDALGHTGGEIVNNAASILLDGPNSNFVDAAGLDALAKFSNNTSAASFTIQNGRNFTSPSDFSNAGAVLIGNNSTFTAGPGGANDYNQTAGTTQVNGTLSAALTHIEGGTLGGAGTITGTVTVGGGTIIAGAPGTLTIEGDLLEDSGGTIIIDIAGAHSFGAIDVTGMASLGGTLDIDFLNGFTPTPGEMFDFFNYGSLNPMNNGFSTIDITGCPNCAAPVLELSGVVFEPEGRPATVPEPSISTLALFAAGLAGIGRYALRRRGAGIFTR
jgi:hypothetical protein